MDDPLAGIPESARERFAAFLEQELLEPSELTARIETFRTAELEVAKTADLAAVARVAGLVSRALTLVEGAAERPEAERRRIQATVLDLTRDPLPAPDTAIRLRTFNVVARTLGAPEDPSLAGVPRAPKPDGRTPEEKARRRRVRAAVVFLIGAGVVPGVFYLSGDRNAVFDVSGGGRSTQAPQTGGPQLRDGYSNVHPGDYVGAEVCGGCHKEKHASWRVHPHARMNQDASPETVFGDFSGERVAYGEQEAVFDRDGDAYRMTIYEGGALVRRYRVTRTVGSRFTQMYIGLLTEGPEPEDHAIYRVEGKLPFGYWLTRDRWYPVNYFDSDFLPDYDEGGSNDAAASANTRLHRWEHSCIFCHNTYAYEHRLRSGLQEAIGFPAGHLRFEPEREERRSLPVGELQQLGVSCESCHFGGREHVQSQGKIAMRFLPSSPDLIFEAASEPLVEDGQHTPYVINSICAQCHSARVTRYPNGASTWNSAEAVDMLGGGCVGELKCTDCHDPHEAGQPGGATVQPRHVAACVGCHDAQATPGHSRHQEVSCLDCHMPRIVQGLDTVIRTHHVGAPSDPRMLSQAAPNACNLCHLDRSIRWTLAELERGWGVRLEADAGWSKAYGDLDRPVGEVWAQHQVPVTRLIAADARSRLPVTTGQREQALDALDDPSPVNRMFALFALERILGRQLGPDTFDPTESPAARSKQLGVLRASLLR